jgi:hypothetical protein
MEIKMPKKVFVVLQMTSYKFLVRPCQILHLPSHLPIPSFCPKKFFDFDFIFSSFKILGTTAGYPLE